MCAFQDHLHLAHTYWKENLQPGDNVIDATCGNGKDTLVLAQILFSHSLESKLIGIDIQQEAIQRTQNLLNSHLSQTQQERIFLYCQSHACFPALAYTMPIRLIVYNFGYLPQGDKSITTLQTSSVESFQAALNLLAPGGFLSAICYPGHAEGMQEQTAIHAYAKKLSDRQWQVNLHTWPGRINSPTLLWIEKTY